MRRLPLIAAAAAAAVLALALAGVGRPGSARGDVTPVPSSKSVTTVGHGVVTVVPDRATISAGVRTSAATAAQALTANASAATKVIAALKQAGGTNLQTQEVSLYPQMSKGRVSGYVAQNTVTADSSIADAGRLIDAAVTAGANTVDGPSLSVSDQDGLYRQALQKAVADARAKAQALAQAGSFGLGAVVSVTEQSAESPVVFAATPAAGKAPSTPVEPGTQDVTADVQVTFAIS